MSVEHGGEEHAALAELHEADEPANLGGRVRGTCQAGLAAQHVLGSDVESEHVAHYVERVLLNRQCAAVEPAQEIRSCSRSALARALRLAE
jgi:hypothetical protein